MTNEEQWNRRECPHCGGPLSDQDLARIAAQAKLTDVGSVTLTEPDGWWKLSCGDRVEIVTHRTPDGANFRLTYRPEAT